MGAHSYERNIPPKFNSRTRTNSVSQLEIDKDQTSAMRHEKWALYRLLKYRYVCTRIVHACQVKGRILCQMYNVCGLQYLDLKNSHLTAYIHNEQEKAVSLEETLFRKISDKTLRA